MANEEKKVKLFVPKSSTNDEPNLIIGINGVNYVLPKGETSEVPSFVKDEYDRSVKAQARYDKTVDRLMSAAAKP